MTQKFCDLCGNTIDRKLPAYELVLNKVTESKCPLIGNSRFGTIERIVIRKMDLCEECMRKFDGYTSYDIGKEENDD